MQAITKFSGEVRHLRSSNSAAAPGAKKKRNFERNEQQVRQRAQLVADDFRSSTRVGFATLPQYDARTGNRQQRNENESKAADLSPRKGAVGNRAFRAVGGGGDCFFHADDTTQQPFRGQETRFAPWRRSIRLWHIGEYAYGWEDAGLDRPRHESVLRVEVAAGLSALVFLHRFHDLPGPQVEAREELTRP